MSYKTLIEKNTPNDTTLRDKLYKYREISNMIRDSFEKEGYAYLENILIECETDSEQSLLILQKNTDLTLYDTYYLEKIKRELGYDIIEEKPTNYPIMGELHNNTFLENNVTQYRKLFNDIEGYVSNTYESTVIGSIYVRRGDTRQDSKHYFRMGHKPLDEFFSYMVQEKLFL